MADVVTEGTTRRGWLGHAVYSDSTINSPDQVDQSQELTYVDIDTFLSTF